MARKPLLTYCSPSLTSSGDLIDQWISDLDLGCPQEYMSSRGDDSKFNILGQTARDYIQWAEPHFSRCIIEHFPGIFEATSPVSRDDILKAFSWAIMVFHSEVFVIGPSGHIDFADDPSCSPSDYYIYMCPAAGTKSQLNWLSPYVQSKE
jgi:hypothetical protein